MSKRFPYATWTLPSVVNPVGRRCFVIEVPDERQHIAAFRGALLNLASAYKWANDSAHTAIEVAAVWQDVYDLVRECRPDTAPSGGVDEGELMIRQNPDNPCELQTSINGTDWCTFADFSLCIPAPNQPGGGTTQPPPGGGQACYQAQLQANGSWVLPTVVSAGDVLEVSNATGASQDGTVSPWRCPNGQTFFAGQCVGAGGTSGTDPLPSANHMRLIYIIDGTAYDAMAGAVTVPGGVSSAEVTLQVNDSTLTDNSGSYQFQVCATNNQSGSWSSTFDFTVDPYSSLLTVVAGSWTPSVGYEGTSTGPTQLSFVAYTLNAGSVDITAMTAYYSCAGHSGASDILAFYQGPGGYIGSPTEPSIGTNIGFNQTISATVNQPGFQVGSGDDAGPVSHSKLIVTGTGIKPSGWPA